LFALLTVIAWASLVAVTTTKPSLIRNMEQLLRKRDVECDVGFDLLERTAKSSFGASDKVAIETS
jgi:hypothetical protein